MMQSCVKSLARVARAFALAAVAFGFSASALAAQSTGKIEGVVRDQNDQPVPNARVVLVGTAFSAVANPQGYWFINSVPAGQYDVRASFVGYAPKEYRGVRILSGQTITQDIVLEQTAVEILEITVVAAENALVPRDQVTSKQLIDGGFTDKLPVDNLNAMFALQPGVMSNSSGSRISVRGGRQDENVTYIDGVPVTPGNRGALRDGTSSGRGVQQIEVGTNQFEDASITTGAASAEFGNAQGGVIAITTRSGGQRFSGNVGFETDEFSGGKMSAGFNRLQASLGGPLAGDLTFFVGGTLSGTRFGRGGFNGWEIPTWVPIGVDTTFAIPKSTSATADTIYLPVQKYAVWRGECDAFYVKGAADPDIANNYGYDCAGNRGTGGGASSSVQLTSKLNWSFGQGSRISLSYIASRDLSRGGKGTDGTFGTTDAQQVLTLNWNQVLSKSSARAVALDAYVSYQSNRSINSLLTDESERNTRDPFLGWYIGGFDYEYDGDDFPVDDKMIREYRLQTATGRTTIYDRANSNQYGTTNSGFGGSIGNPGSIGSFGSAPGTLNTANETRLLGKANLDWQVDRYNRVKIGGEYTQYELDTYNVGAASQGFSDIWKASPVRYNLFAEDRLDLGDVVLVGSLRYDYYKLGAEKWKDFPRISSWPGFTPDSLEGRLEEYSAHSYVSPHIQVAFPVTERTNFRLSYGQQVQTPDFATMLFGSNTDLATTNTNQNYGTDLDFGKTILFEFGVRHAFSDDMVFDVTVFNKDNLANAAGRLLFPIDPRTGSPGNVRATVNADFGNTRGIDMRLDRRIGNIFNGALAYTYQDARNTGSDPYSYINFGARITSAVTGNAISPPQAAQPVAYSRPHSLAAQAAFNFPADFAQGTVIGAIMSRGGIYATARYSSGTAYTRCDPSLEGEQNLVSGNTCNTIFGDYNASRLPAYKMLDLRVTKGFRLGSLDLTAYADARNVLNIKNIQSVFAQTGSIQNERYRQRLWVTDSSTFAQVGLANGVYNQFTGDMSLPGSDASCGAWVTTGQTPSPPTCYFYRKAEQRFGNGDGIYSLEEQRRASDMSRLGTFHISRFAAGGRLLRFGMEVNF
jgi:outer membrane receptor for ferrienterochelin and colicin